VVALLYLLGFLSLAFSVGVYVLLAILRRRVSWSLKWLLLTVPLGLMLGLDAANVSYRQSPTSRIVGFPFPSSLLELHGGSWWSFPDPGTNFGFAGNLFIGFSIPHTVLLTVLVVRARKAGRGGGRTPRPDDPGE
jgi:hypothetical protein